MQVLTVGQVLSYLQSLLGADRLLGDIWISGEVSNLNRSAAGHAYFTLKDAKAQLRCVMFRSASARSGAYDNAEGLANGVAVVAHGRLAVYEARGDLQLVVDLVQPEGAGRQHLEFQRLRAKLEAEGLFDPARKRPLPRFPRRIGVVTSPRGAVLHDIQQVVGRRYPIVELVLAPCQVQGEGAAATIAAAVQKLNQRGDLDLIIVARGGGSLEELWPFNEETVARAIYASKAPVVSAVGHETDYTIADLVADVRAPTPSAAAAQAVPDRQELLRTLEAHRRRLQDGLGRLLAEQRRLVEGDARRAQAALPSPARLRQATDELLRELSAWVARSISQRRERLQGRLAHLQSLGPQSTLERGYALVYQGSDGRLVTSIGEVSAGAEVQVRVQDGAFPAQVSGPGEPNP
ncbi:MAG: exodeoxyribonuclease VII large subunit [Chloroflexi bacterium]|nr:exodeoxyribonuclease VII large subunit [Chloroflexota bacterium]